MTPPRGDDEHVAGVGRRVADDRGQNQHRRQQAGRRAAQKQLEAGVDEAGLLGHADAEQRHQHHAQRREPGEGGHQLDHERGQGRARQLVGDAQRLAGARVRLGELDGGEQRRGDPGQQQQQQEQDGRVGKPVAGVLDEVQGAGDEASARVGRLRCRIGLRIRHLREPPATRVSGPALRPGRRDVRASARRRLRPPRRAAPGPSRPAPASVPAPRRSRPPA